MAHPRLDAWKADPRVFVREAFKVTPDPWQDEVLAAFPRHQRLAMKACKGPGKTAVLAWLAWNFLATRRGAKMAATSITGENLADNLWAEMATVSSAATSNGPARASSPARRPKRGSCRRARSPAPPIAPCRATRWPASMPTA